MSIKAKYSVESISFADCKEWLLKKHYAKRIPPVEYSYGLFESKILIAVITFGTPVSNPLRLIWGGVFRVIELNRLVINEGCDKNSLSFFVSSAIKLLPAPMVIVSYADTSQNHHGYIYQATNFIYTGLSAKRSDYKITGMEHLHGHTIADMSRGKENRSEWLRQEFGDKFSTEERARKHRYFYFTGTKFEIKKMKSMLPYKVEAYPKGDNSRYDANYTPVIQMNIF